MCDSTAVFTNKARNKTYAHTPGTLSTEMCQTFVLPQRIFGIISPPYARLFFLVRIGSEVGASGAGHRPFLATTWRWRLSA
jgi:hypothetical protein